MAGNYPQKQERKKPRAPFDLFNLTLWTPSVAEGKSASLNWGVTADGKITVTTRSGNPADKEKYSDGDTIRISFPHHVFHVFLGFMGEAARSKGPYKRGIAELGWFTKKDGQSIRLDQPRTNCELIVGKDDQGVMFIALTKYKRDNYEFRFAPEHSRRAFDFKHENGNVFTEGETSVAYASGYIKTLSELYEIVRLSDLAHKSYASDYEERYDPKKAHAGGGGGNGGGQRSGGGSSNSGGSSNGGGNNSYRTTTNDDMEDDDIPY